MKLHNESCAADGDCAMPRFVANVSGTLQPIPESQAPANLVAKKFPEKKSTQRYDQLASIGARACLSSPGPADQALYCAQTLKGGESSTWIGYKWYKFVDQPGLQQAKLSETERNFMQQRVETLHRMSGPTTRWMTAKGAEVEGLAIVDGAALVNPPAGLEHGYVPVALYEGFEKPDGCHAPPPVPPTPPSPPRPVPTPAPTPPAPTPTTCEGWCTDAGHCCVGAVSSYNHPSCAMGCFIAKNTKSVEECKSTCLANDKTCTWKIGGQTMSNCQSCPSGCSAAGGVDECLFGCEHGSETVFA